jgi:hypothetical protein
LGIKEAMSSDIASGCGAFILADLMTWPVTYWLTYLGLRGRLHVARECFAARFTKMPNINPIYKSIRSKLRTFKDSPYYQNGISWGIEKLSNHKYWRKYASVKTKREAMWASMMITVVTPANRIFLPFHVIIAYFIFYPMFKQWNKLSSNQARESESSDDT